jgi:glutamate synthase (NADPH/NADH) small chain
LKNIIERGFAEGWIKPQIPAVRTGKTVAVIGSDLLEWLLLNN